MAVTSDATAFLDLTGKTAVVSRGGKGDAIVLEQCGIPVAAVCTTESAAAAAGAPGPGS
jgi:hypothetical protein